MTQVVDITEAAAFHIQEMMRNNGEEGSYLRVGIKGGGCSGLSYAMVFDHEKQEDDEVFEEHGLQIVVSSEDAPILQGTKIDFKQSLMGGGFTIDNPNAIASCGCGSSFRTAKNAGTPEEC
ncbi:MULTISPECIES: HesB/IscA family protein [Rummeliibacillus]|jgi:Iron-sulfur cluster assembly accessory protein|uniref:HesB/IscA family protein n=1 Tax=Rummeliibacillus TaxID=648802 RepID=UPI0011B4BF16|nr:MULTISPECIES: iron-sulfur cluster assembly accessory protein [Rummeliibacillus]MBO2537512.1 iron-sulfur cluster assembly accessory protein [Rummeliibacillus suwonensis]